MSQIAARAEELLKDLGLFSAPVKVDAVAGALNLSVYPEELEDDVSGVLVVNNGSGSVLLNQRQSPNRRRFTLAHEIGHFVLHWLDGQKEDRLFLDRRYPTFSKVDDSVYLRSSSKSTSPDEERQANEFASAMLMPRQLVLDYVKSSNLAFTDEEDVARCARAFQVSEQAMLIRLKRLGLLKIS